MRTSYFAKSGIQENPNALSIALYAPRWWGKGRRYPALAPTEKMLKQAKESGTIYSKQEYFDLLKFRGLDPAILYAELKDNILCCWEKTGKPCHRRYAAEWFEANLPGVEIPEFE